MPVGPQLVTEMVGLLDKVLSVKEIAAKNFMKTVDYEAVDVLKSDPNKVPIPKAPTPKSNMSLLTLWGKQFEPQQPAQAKPSKPDEWLFGPSSAPKAKAPEPTGQDLGLPRPAIPGAELQERAQTAGYTTPAFRGVSKPPRQSPTIDPNYGYYSTQNPKLANLYATEFHDGMAGKPSIMPLLLNTSEYHTVDAKGKSWSQINDKAIKDARAQGKKGVVVQNVFDEPHSTEKLQAPQTVYITLDMTTARSKSAAFDPTKLKLNDLLASGAAILVPAGALEAVMSGEAKAQEAPQGDPQGASPAPQQGEVALDTIAPGTGDVPGSSPPTQRIEANGKIYEMPAGMPDDEIKKLIAADSSYLGRTKDIGGDIGDIAHEGMETFKSAAGSQKRLLKSITEVPGAVMSGDKSKMLGAGYDVVKGLGDVLSAPMTAAQGAFDVATSPVMGSLRAMGSRPLEEKTGIPKGLTEFAATIAAPAALSRAARGAVSAAKALAPSKELVTATGDDLFKLRNWITADKAELAQHLDTMPHEFKTAQMQDKFYTKLEDPAAVLTPEEQVVFDQYIQPMRLEIQKLSQTAGKFGYPLQDEEYVHRVVKGKEGDPVVGQGGAAVEPQLGSRTLARSTAAMRERSLYVLEADDGRRAVVSSPSPGYLSVWNKGKAQTVKWGDDLEVGNPLMINGKKFTVKQAKTAELEAETPFRFQKSAAVNMGDALVKMRATVRSIQYLDALTQTPDWALWATKKIGKAPADWRTPDIPQLKDWKVHPKLANAFDDFFSPNIESKGILDGLRKVNRFAVGSLFWNPTPHIENVAGHWFVGRGFDWAWPPAYKSMFKTGSQAIKEVTTLGGAYKDMLKHGSGLIYGGVVNADFYRVLGKKFGLEIERNPGEWGKMANKLGMGVPDLVKSFYGGMNRVLWWANDVFMMQRVLELEAKGMSRLHAIREAEKHIPNYRVPTEVMGSRAFSKAMQDPAVTAFGRYHYGMWNSYTNMVRDLVGKGKTPKERFEAIGNMMALGALTYGVYPAVSAGIQKLTGDTDIRKMRRGPASIPDVIQKALTSGERQWYDVIGNSITLAPAFKEGLQQLTDRDFLTGQHIEEPGETSPARRAAQRAEHAAQSMVAPYQQGAQIAKSLDEHGVPRQILDSVVGVEDKTGLQKRGQARGQKFDRRAAKMRKRKPKGVIEQLGGTLE